MKMVLKFFKSIFDIIVIFSSELLKSIGGLILCVIIFGIATFWGKFLIDNPPSSVVVIFAAIFFLITSITLIMLTYKFLSKRDTNIRNRQEQSLKQAEASNENFKMRFMPDWLLKSLKKMPDTIATWTIELVLMIFALMSFVLFLMSVGYFFRSQRLVFQLKIFKLFKVQENFMSFLTQQGRFLKFVSKLGVQWVNKFGPRKRGS